MTENNPIDGNLLDFAVANGRDHDYGLSTLAVAQETRRLAVATERLADATEKLLTIEEKREKRKLREPGGNPFG